MPIDAVNVTFWPAFDGLSEELTATVGVGSEGGVSTTRDRLVGVRLMFTRMRSVVNAVKFTLRFTRLLPVTVPSGTHEIPSKPSTVKSRTPSALNVIASLGSTGAE